MSLFNKIKSVFNSSSDDVPDIVDACQIAMILMMLRFLEFKVTLVN